MTTAEIRKLYRKGLENLGRAALKSLHLIVTGEQVFGVKADIVDKTREAVEEYLGIA